MESAYANNEHDPSKIVKEPRKRLNTFRSLSQNSWNKNSRNWGYLVILVSNSGTDLTQETKNIRVGLTTAKSLANELGGEVYLQSKENVGVDASFSVQMRDHTCTVN